MKKALHTIGWFCLLCLLPARSLAAGELDKVLAQLDAAATRFQNAKADFVWDNYTKVVDEHEKQSGTTYFERTAGQTQMAAQILQPDKKTVVYTGSKLYFYQPSLDQLTVFSAGENRAQYESFLTLGFGSSGKDLASVWDITYLGPETLGGIATVKLDLKGKAANVRSTFDHVTVWIDPTRAVTVQQQFFYSSGDMRTVLYSEIKHNAKLPASAFAIPTAKNVVQK